MTTDRDTMKSQTRSKLTDIDILLIKLEVSTRDKYERLTLKQARMHILQAISKMDCVNEVQA